MDIEAAEHCYLGSGLWMTKRQTESKVFVERSNKMTDF